MRGEAQMPLPMSRSTQAKQRPQGATALHQAAGAVQTAAVAEAALAEETRPRTGMRSSRPLTFLAIVRRGHAKAHERVAEQKHATAPAQVWHGVVAWLQHHHLERDYPGGASVDRIN